MISAGSFQVSIRITIVNKIFSEDVSDFCNVIIDIK